MKITTINKICDIIGDVNVSIIGYKELWDDFKKDFPTINELLMNQPDEVIMLTTPIVSAYVSGWMRARGEKK